VPVNKSFVLRLLINWRGLRSSKLIFEAQPRQSISEMVSGESHYLWGREHRLDIVKTSGKHKASIKGNNINWLQVSDNTTADNRLKLLNGLYRQQVQKTISMLLPYWQERLNVESSSVGIKKMKTKWGSCNIEAKNLWINLELAKKPVECIEFILVHELVHFIERHHNERFKGIMDKHRPNWRERRSLLNSLPLAYEDWSY
jgi:predicted metal-dependent hydrolase